MRLFESIFSFEIEIAKHMKRFFFLKRYFLFYKKIKLFPFAKLSTYFLFYSRIIRIAMQ